MVRNSKLPYFCYIFGIPFIWLAFVLMKIVYLVNLISGGGNSSSCYYQCSWSSLTRLTVGEPLAQISLVLDMMLTCPGDIQHTIPRYYSSSTDRDCCWCMNSRFWWPPMTTPNKTAAGIGGFRSRSIGLKNGLFQSSTTRGAGPLPLFPETTRGSVTLIAWDWGYLRARSPWCFECKGTLLHLQQACRNKRNIKKKRKLCKLCK
jgi:hypothetical protein